MIIYKYQISRTSRSVMMPEKAVPVHAGIGPDGNCCIWAQVDPNAFLVKKKIRIVGTGEDYGEEWLHAFTWVDSVFVWHLLLHKDFYS